MRARIGIDLSVRWRLTLFYLLVSAASSAILLALVYWLVRRSRNPDFFLISDLPWTTDVPLTEPVPGPDGVSAPDTQLLFNTRVDAVDQTLNNLLLWSGLGLVVTAAISVGVGWFLAGRVLAPVHTITQRARNISAQALDERVALGGPHDEMRELADTFDSLLDRIQTVLESERRLVATMSHELRTPLANQQVALDVALGNPRASAAELRQAAEIALGQSGRASRTVEALLTLAQVQSGLVPARHEHVDMMAVVTDAVDRVRAEEGSTRPWHVHVAPVTVLGDAELLDRAVANLLQNAERHNLPGSAGWVDVRLEAAGSDAVLDISSSGPKIDLDAAAELTLPFRRGARDRTDSDRGVGLGLSIVQAVTDHHGGRLDLRPLQPNGLAVRLTLPLENDHYR